MIGPWDSRKAIVDIYVNQRANTSESSGQSNADAQPGELGRLLIALGCSAVGLAPAGLGIGDPVVWIAWFAVIAFPVGVFVGSSRLRAWPFGFAAPGVWMIALAWLDARAGGLVPDPVWAALAWSGLFALGAAVGAFSGGQAWRDPALALSFSALLAYLPVSGGPGTGLWGGRPLGQVSPSIAARLFDASPVTLVIESAGFDWMRHRAIYRAAGTEWFSDRRRPYRGKLAGPAVLLLGCVGMFLGRRRSRALGRLHEPAIRQLENREHDRE